MSQVTNATNIARMTAETTPINSGPESANSCTAPPAPPKKKARVKTVERLQGENDEMKTVKKNLMKELSELKKSHNDELRKTKKTSAEELKKAEKTIEALTKAAAGYEKKIASLTEKNKALMIKKNLYTRPTRLPSK